MEDDGIRIDPVRVIRPVIDASPSRRGLRPRKGTGHPNSVWTIEGESRPVRVLPRKCGGGVSSDVCKRRGAGHNGTIPVGRLTIA